MLPTAAAMKDRINLSVNLRWGLEETSSSLNCSYSLNSHILNAVSVQNPQH